MKTLVNKFLTNTISSEELVILKKWLEDPKNKEYLKEVLNTNQQLDYAYRPIDIEKAYQQIVKITSTQQKTVKLNSRFPVFFKYAAALLIMLGIGITYYMNRPLNNEVILADESDQVTLQLEDGSFAVLKENESGVIANKEGENIVKHEQDKLVYAPSENVQRKLVYNVLKVPYGKRFKIELADGTLVVLNSGTKLRYPKDFTDPNSRDVFLSGEALFSVQKDADHPFVVHTDKMNIRVLGTQFNVSSYENETTTSAVLVEGLIEVDGAEKQNNTVQRLAISPGQMATAMNGEFNVVEVEVEKHIAWIDGTLFFINDPFKSIIKELERHYDIKIINKNQELNDVRYTGTFRSETLEQILQVFQKNTEFDYEVKKDTILIDMKNL